MQISPYVSCFREFLVLFGQVFIVVYRCCLFLLKLLVSERCGSIEIIVTEKKLDRKHQKDMAAIFSLLQHGIAF